MAIPGLDDVDNRIIELLCKNARMSYSEIGAAVGKSRVAVKTRIEQLEKKGIICGYSVLIDSSAVPGGIEFTLDIETTPQEYESVIARLSTSNMVQKIYGTSGECHIHAIGLAPNSDTLGTYARHLHRSVEGIRRLSWQFLVTTYKDTERGVEYDEIRHQEHEHLEGSSGEEEKQE